MIDKQLLMLAKLSGDLSISFGMLRSSGSSCEKCKNKLHEYVCLESYDLHIHICRDCYKKIFNELTLPAKED